MFLMETKNADNVVLDKLKDLRFDSHFFCFCYWYWKLRSFLVMEKCFKYSDIIFQQESHRHLGDPQRCFLPCLFYLQRTWSLQPTCNLEMLISHFWQPCYPRFFTLDINEIIQNKEKSGGPLRAEGTFGAFRSFLAQHDLFDLKHSCNFLSWRGKRGTHLVYCRLNRALGNGNCSDVFANGWCQYLEFQGPDHHPLMSFFEAKRRTKSSIFRFDRRLRDNVKIKQLVAATWHAHSETTVHHRLSYCRKAIVSWSREKARNSIFKIERIQKELNENMTNPNGCEN